MSIVTAPRTLAYTSVAVLLALIIGGAAGFKLGYELGKAAEHSATEACEKKVTQAVQDTDAKVNKGQAALAGSESQASAAALDSTEKRQAVLDTAESASSAARASILNSTPKASTSKLGVSTTPQASTPSQPCTTVEDPVIPLATVRVINQLLEISNGTQFFDLSASSDDAGDSVVTSSYDSVLDDLDGGNVVVLYEHRQGLGSDSPADVLQTVAEAGGPGVLAGRIPNPGEQVGIGS